MSKHLKVLTAWLFSLLLTAGSLALPAQAVETPNDGVCDIPGTGTSWAGAFQISNVAQFKELPDCDHATEKRYFILLNNLDLGGSASPWTPLQGFNGWLDGNSKTISNLFIDLPNANTPTGLFGATGELALIQNLFLTVTMVQGKNAVGALAGRWNGGYIEDVTVTAANNSHQFVRSATGYSITSNLLTINMGANHGVSVGAQLATGQFGFGPVIGGRHLTVSSVDQVAGTITLPYEANDLAQTSLSASLSIINPVVSGETYVGGAIGWVTSFSTSGFDGLVQAATAHVIENLSAALSVYGNEVVGGLVGYSYVTNFKGPSFTGSVAAHNAIDARIDTGGLAGYSADDFWQSASVEATVSSSGANTGGFFGNNLGRGFPLWCGYGGMPILSLESTSANVVSITYASASDHELSVNDAVAFKGPAGSAYEHGVIGSVAAVNGAVVTIATTVNNPGLLANQAVSEQSSYLLKIQTNSPSNPNCDVGAYNSEFSGTVTGGRYFSLTAAGLVAGYSLSNNFKNVTVSGDVFGSGNMVGGFVGWSMRNGFENVVYESGSVLGADEVGGLVGRASGWTRGTNPTKLAIASQVTINADSISGRDSVGGIAGIATSMTFSNVESSSAIYGYSYAGGLVGKADASTSIKDSEYSGSWVYGPGGYVGGIAGDISGTEAAVAIAGASRLSASTTRFTTSTRHLLQQGDRVWVKFGSESISKVAEVINVPSTTQVDLDLATDGSYSPASGDVLVELNSIVDTHVTTSLPVGNAGSIRADASFTGGLAGKISSTIVSGSSNALQLRIDPAANVSEIGGLIGEATMSEPHIASISESYSTANIYFDGTFANASGIGGLVGNMVSVDLSTSYFSGNIFNLPGVVGASVARLGGLVGRLEDSRITSSFARAELRITNDVPAAVLIGGLVGNQLVTNLSASETALVGSFFDGVISAPQGVGIAGLAGSAGSPITYSHATATLGGNLLVGGLVGDPYANADILYSYFDGSISRGDTVTDTQVVGISSYTGDDSKAYWNSSAMSSNLINGARTAAQLSDPDTFSSWSSFGSYFEMPNASLTTKPFPTLTRLMRSPEALTVQTPATNLNGILQGETIVPITASAWGYPRPILQASNTLPAGLSVSGFQVTGAPTQGGSYSFTLAARNQEGSGPTTTFTGSVASLTPPAYTGPILEIATPTPARPGQKVVIRGSNLGSVSAISIGGTAVNDLLVGNDSVSFTVPSGFKTGAYDLALSSSFGNLTVQGFLKVGASEVGASIRKIDNSSAKVRLSNLAGNGKVQIFANGREIAWARVAADAPSSAQSSGLVRNVRLNNGKNVIEIFVNGVRIKRVSYSK